MKERDGVPGNREEAPIVIVGAGMAGLVAAASLAKEGHSVKVFEAGSEVGGLVQSFSREGFTFDAGPRAIGNAGIVLPMLRRLGIELPLLPSPVSIGLGKTIVHFDEEGALEAWLARLEAAFPQERKAIGRIARRIRSYTNMMATLNRVDNPVFRPPLSDLRFLVTTFIPWLPSFLGILVRTALVRRSIEAELARLSSNRALNDMVSQHFFKGTPLEFALGYFHNYTDYRYPRGGTGSLPQALFRFACEHGVQFVLNTAVTAITPAAHTVCDAHGSATRYRALIWAADLKTLYARCQLEGLSPGRRRRAARRRARLDAAHSAESVYTLFVATSLPPSRFARISRGHFIHTPCLDGLGEIQRGELARLKARFNTVSQEDFFEWLAAFCRKTSYEIAIPALRDASLAPEGQTGLVISVLFDGELCRLVEERGWYGEFKKRMDRLILEALESSVYPGLEAHVLFTDSATPASLARRFGTTDGSIVGWSLEESVPAASHLAQVFSAVRTPLPGIFQAGQWTYSPAGVPVAVLTGALAAQSAGRAAQGTTRAP